MDNIQNKWGCVEVMGPLSYGMEIDVETTGCGSSNL